MKTKKKGNIILILLILLQLFLFLNLTSLPAKAATNMYNENFMDTSYRDAPNTNVTGWGLGDLSSPKQNPPIVGACDTDSARRVALSGNYAYVADFGAGLKIINITHPLAPVQVGNYSTPDNAWDVCISGDHAFITADNEGLLIINVSDPTAPTLTGSCKLPSSLDMRRVTVSGDYAYVIGSGRFAVIDISNLSAPVVKKWVISPNTYCVAVAGDYAYVGYSDGSLDADLAVYDISDPINFAKVYDLHTCLTVHAIQISGDFAYMTAWPHSFKVVDLSDPAHPVNASMIQLPGYIYGVWVEGDYAYVGLSMAGLQVIDISDPYAPVLVGIRDTYHDCQHAVVSGNYVYATDASYGLQVIQISDPIPPTVIKTCEIDDTPQELFVSGDCAYVADGAGGMLVVDLRDPTNPTTAGAFNETGYATSVQVSGDYAYIAGSGLQVVNISDPTTPEFAANYSSPGGAQDVWVDGNYVYLADLEAGLRVVNITDPLNPTSAGSLDTPGQALGVEISGNYAYIADNLSLQIIDITDPTNPALASTYTPNNSGYVLEVSIAGDLAYLSTGVQGLEIVDISNPQSPSGVASLATPTHDHYIYGDLLYATDESNGKLYVLDIEDPKHPLLINDCNLTYPQTSDVLVLGDHAYVLGHNATSSGLQVVEVSWHKSRQYVPLSVAQSTRIFSGGSTVTLTKATLACVDSTPPGTSITYYLSPDDGANWEEVTPTTEHSFAHPGRYLKWKAVFASSESLNTATLSNISVTYTTRLNSPNLVNPSNSTYTNDTTPTFSWSSLSGATGYLLQLDTLDSFDTPDLIEATVGSTSYTPASELSEGIWYWRTAANDSSGDLGFFSQIRTLTIDITPPTLNSIPKQTYTEGTNMHNITWTPSDLYLASFIVKRGSTVIRSGPWTGDPIEVNLGGLSVGTYYYNCTVYDTAGNKVTKTVEVEVKEKASSPIPFGTSLLVLSAIIALACISFFLKKKGISLLP